MGPLKKLNCLDDLIYITTEYVQSQQKCMSKNDKVIIIKCKMPYSESGPDSNFAINSASNFDSSESKSESDFSSVFIDICIFFTPHLHSSK